LGSTSTRKKTPVVERFPEGTNVADILQELRSDIHARQPTSSAVGQVYKRTGHAAAVGPNKLSAAGYRVETRKRGPVLQPLQDSAATDTDVPVEKTAREDEEALWSKASELFPDSLIPQSPPKPKNPPGLYILQWKTKGIILNDLLRFPVEATSALEELLRDTSELPNALFFKVSSAWGQI
jgi:hypothetical protein